MRAKSVFLLMLALGCGLVASIGITQVMAKRNSEPAGPTTEMTSIFVAMEDIPMGEPINARMIKLEEWPKDKIPEGTLSVIEEVENRRPKARILQGMPILEKQLLSEGASAVASGQIPKGFRVVSVRVDNVSGGNMIRPSDRVDVLVHLTKCATKEIAQTTTRTILQDIKVFAVNDLYDLDSTDSTNKMVAQTISLLVPLNQAEKVILADELGDIRLVMRSPEDDEAVHTGGAHPNELFGPLESGDRDEEGKLFATDTLLHAPGETQDFVEFLNAQKKADEPAKSAAAPASAENWTIRTISGSEVDQVVLQLEGDDADGTGSGFSLWKLISSSMRGDNSSAPKPDTEPNDEPDSEPDSADEPEPTDQEPEELDTEEPL